MVKDTPLNREKVYCTDGKAYFVKVYNCTEALPGGSLCVPLPIYKATKVIKKSPDSKSNRNKICKKGRTLYVVGAVAGPDSREYLVFSEETWVFKREWGRLKDLVTFAGFTVTETKVTKTGEVKDKWETPRQSWRKVTKVCCLEVQFTNDPRSTVWFTPYGLQHMASLVTSVSAAMPLSTDICTMKHMKKTEEEEEEEEEEKEEKNDISCDTFHKNECRTSSTRESAGSPIKEEESSQTEAKPEDNSCKASKQTEAEAEAKAQAMETTLTGQTGAPSKLMFMPCNRVPPLFHGDIADNTLESLSPQEDYNECWSFPYV